MTEGFYAASGEGTVSFAGRQVDVLVVGAGMAGLMAAGALRDAGRSVLTVDKGRGVGGRMATRRTAGATFDHGAQFVTARDRRFAAAMGDLERRGAARVWCRGFEGDSGAHPRWCGTSGMTSIARALASPLDVLLNTRVASLRSAEGRWHAETSDGLTITAQAVVLTPPVPQSCALLEAGSVVLPDHARSRLSAISYDRCIAVMAELSGPSQVPPPGGIAPSSEVVAWIADNRAKGVSDAPSVTIHATPAFSTMWWDRDRQETGAEVLRAGRRWIGSDVAGFQVHGWLYSRPVTVAEGPAYLMLESPPLVFAGDAFGGARVEGAALSGWAAAEALLSLWK